MPSQRFVARFSVDRLESREQKWWSPAAPVSAPGKASVIGPPALHGNGHVAFEFALNSYICLVRRKFS